MVSSQRKSLQSGGSLNRLAAAEALLWQGDVEAAKALSQDCRRKQARNFEVYLSKHRARIVNYQYYQAEQLTVLDRLWRSGVSR